MSIDIASAAVLSLLAERALGTTICPSEVARTIAAEASPDDEARWRAAMPLVHAAVDRLVERKDIGLSWKGRELSARSGPYRIGRASGSGRDSLK